MKLVAITRILNEDDIVEAFVRHHAAIVDHHLFLDNGSTDRTLEILQALKSEGFKLTVLQNDVPFYTEVSYNTNLFKHARSVLAADWVLFLDADEFLEMRYTSNGLRALIGGLGTDDVCLSIPCINYVDLPTDDPAELIVPMRMRSRERTQPLSTLKMFVSGPMADAGAIIEGGQHSVALNGQPVDAYASHWLTLAHYYRRSSWQEVSKAVMGRLKVFAAGRQGENRSTHYKQLYDSIRKNPAGILDPSFIRSDYSWLDLVEDPLPYLGGPLRYTKAEDAAVKAMRVLIAYAEQLAMHHGMLIDSSDIIRAQTAQAALKWQQLF